MDNITEGIRRVERTSGVMSYRDAAQTMESTITTTEETGMSTNEGEEQWRKAIEEMRKEHDKLEGRVDSMTTIVKRLEETSEELLQEATSNKEILKELREDRGKINSLEKQVNNTNASVMRMERMMMMLVMNNQQVRGGNTEGIENEIAMLRLTQHEKERNTVSEKLLIEHTQGRYV